MPPVGSIEAGSSESFGSLESHTHSYWNLNFFTLMMQDKTILYQLK
jgi:hypothetical protein